MNKPSLFLLIVSSTAAIHLMAACDKENNDGPDSPVKTINVTVSPEVLTSGPDAVNLDFSVTADADWAVRSDADWLSIRPSGGLKNQTTTVQLAVKANTLMDERVADINIISGGKTVKTVTLTQGYVMKATASTSSVIMGGQQSSSSLSVTANADWTITSDAAWLNVSPAAGPKGTTEVTLTAKENDLSDTREATVTLTCGESVSEINVSQLSDVINAPEGYTLVWSDEFNKGPEPGSDWVLENWAAGHVNNELQTYTSHKVDGKATVEVKDGFLNINCIKGSDGKIYSGRMNALPSKGWLYGYFEARIMLPKGKGTWPAFWMMPSNVDWSTNGWPTCGEIDIMEEVGANPDYVSSSLHTENYNHTKGNQKTHEMKCPGAEDSFHIYALEWTEDEIITYVDGKQQLKASRASMGTDHKSWPFHYAFYPILNLAWGGDWGGYKGVDDSALPVTMKVDYVRIFQKQ